MSIDCRDIRHTICMRRRKTGSAGAETWSAADSAGLVFLLEDDLRQHRAGDVVAGLAS